MRKVLTFVVVVASVMLPSCSRAPMQSGIDQSTMDKTVRPQDDLYRYMNGTWLRTFVIPPDRSRYGTFTKLADDAEKNLRSIIEEAAAEKEKSPGSDAQKVGDMFTSFMDSARVESLGITPISSNLEEVQEAKTREDLIRLAARFEKEGIGGPVLFFVDQDPKRSTQYIANLYQSGLSLPDRDYYFRSDKRFVEIREKFLAHIANMLTLAGIPDATKKAQTIFGMEMEMAKAHWTKVDNRDPIKTYNKFSFAGLESLTPRFDWTLFASGTGCKHPDSVIIAQPSFLKAFGEVFWKTPIEVWKTYYSWCVINSAAPYLSSRFVAEHFDFFSRTLRGTQENRPRWKRGVGAVDRAMGELVGRLYVEKFFRPEAKDRMVKLVANLEEALRERIRSLSWMSAETKEKALAKLEKFGTKIGYPDKWRDYSALTIDPKDLIGNMRRAELVEFERNMNKLGAPIDRTEWDMTPQTVNAYYNEKMNEIVFPAAILQPPFFNVDADDAVNYGGIGAAIGHEMTHGFDDQGRKSDGDGNLTDWWTNTDEQEFLKRAQVMVNQYSAFVPIDTLHLNGRLTLGENIADLGGLTIAYRAYHNSLQGKEAPVMDGMTGDQRFFLGWAQGDAGLLEEEPLTG